MKKQYIAFLILIIALTLAFAAACTPDLTEIELKAGTMPTELAQFSTPDYSDVVIIATFADGTFTEITAADLTFSEIDTDTLGEKTVTVTYNGKTATFTVEVVLATNIVDSIAVKAGTFEDEILYGEDYDYSDIIVELTYHNEYKVEIPASDTRLDISEIDTEILGEQTVTIEFSDSYNTTPITASFDVDVILSSYVMKSVSVKSGTYPAYIALGTEVVDLSDLIIVVVYDNYDGEGTDLTLEYSMPMTGLTIDDIDTDTLGPQEIGVSYEDAANTTPLTDSFDVTIVQGSFIITGIAVKAGTAPTTVIQDEDPDYSEVVVIATFDNSVTQKIYFDDLSFSAIDTTVLGQKQVTVSYSDEHNETPLTTTFNIEVVACTEVISLEVTDGITDIQQNSPADFEDLIIEITYANGRKATVPGTADTISFGSVDTSIPGVKTVTVSYSDEYNTTPITGSFEVTVVKASQLEDGYYVALYEKPAFLNTFLSNIAEGTTGENAYMDKTEGYYVGSMNAFTVMPRVTVVNRETLHSVVLTSYTSDYIVEIYDNEDEIWTLLEDEDLEPYAEIDSDNSSFQFTTLANDRKFKLTLDAKAADIYGSNSFDPISFEVNVIDAYNVYNATDLSVFDNFNNKGVWTDYKTENNIPTDLDINGIVLHNNIAITQADLPESYFYTEDNGATYAAAGSLKRWTYAYVRKSADTLKSSAGETFNFIGNYFSIDASAIPLGTERNESTAPPISYSTLFNFMQNSSTDVNIDLNGGSEGVGTGAAPNEVNVNWDTNNIKNITFIGNATRAAGEEEMVRMGGLIMIKSNARMLNVYNSILRRDFTDIYVVNGEANFLFDKSKTYDAYSNSMLFWENIYKIDGVYSNAGKTSLIRDSIIKRCGGPAIIVNDYDTESGGTYTNTAYVEVEDSTIESYVTGEEGWFKANNASAAMGQIKALDAIFNLYGKAYTSSGGSMLNFMFLMMPGNPLTDEYPLNAWVKIDGVIINNFSNPYVQTYMSLTSNQAPIFQTSNGAVCFYSNAPMDGLYDANYPTAMAPTSPVITDGSNYITCYLPLGTYLGAVFSYGNYTPA